MIARRITESMATIGLSCMLTVTLLAACGDESRPRIAPAVTESPTPLPTPTPVLAPTVPPTVARVPDPTATPTLVPAHTVPPTVTRIPDRTATPTPALSLTAPPTVTPVPAPTATLTPVPTQTPASEESIASRLSSILPWYGAPPDRRHKEAAASLLGLWAVDSGIGETVARLPWVQDGIDIESDLFENERRALELVLNIASLNLELAVEIVGRYWFSDGIDPGDGETLFAIASQGISDPERAADILQVRDAAEGALASDPQALGRLYSMADKDIDFTLDTIERANQLDGDMGPFFVRSMSGIRGFADERRLLFAQPWFADGLSQQEAALIVPLPSTIQSSPLSRMIAPDLYPTLVESGHVQHKAVSLPLAGGTNIWVVQNVPSPAGEDLAGRIEQAARLAEDVFQRPFPATDIIGLVITPSQGDSFSERGLYDHNHFWIVRNPGEPLTSLSRDLYHETAHYFATSGPRWLSEGTADFMSTYVADREGDESLEGSKRATSATVESLCRGQHGLANIDNLNAAYETAGNRSMFRCFYKMGEDLLHRLTDEIGIEAVYAALGEIYGAGHRLDEESIYESFLNHTPPLKQETFRELYRRLHGGPFTKVWTNMEDDHGDSRAEATRISVGATVDGNLDYELDFDFFVLTLEDNVSYWLEVTHPTLSVQNVEVIPPSGTQVSHNCWNLALCDDTSDGPVVYWRAFRAGDYLIRIQNLHGDTGSYRLTVTRAGIPDDHGNFQANATDIAIGETVRGHLEDGIDTDTFRFVTQAGQEYHAVVEYVTLDNVLEQAKGIPPADVHVWGSRSSPGTLQVYDQDKVRLDDGHSVTWVSPSSGPYYFAIESLNRSIGTYTLRISESGDAGE